MSAVRDDVTTYFATKGITITVLGMKDGIDYDDPEIQKAINAKFSSEQLLVTQENNNNVIISKANAEAQAKLIQAEAEADANRKLAESLTPELIDMKQLEKWNGELPQIVSDSTVIKDFVG